MKYTHIFLSSLFCFAVLFACKSDTTNTAKVPFKTEQERPQEIVTKDIPQAVNEDKTPKPESTTVKAKETPPPPPPASKEKLEATKQLTNISPFLAIGCCKNESQRQDHCCCDAVLEQYKKMKTANDAKLVEYSMTDPILGACKRKKSDVFDVIDNPPVEKAEDDFSDLF